jgi:hypothetical protein
VVEDSDVRHDGIGCCTPEGMTSSFEALLDDILGRYVKAQHWP